MLAGVEDVDGDEYPAGENSDAGEEVTEHAEEAQEEDGVEAEFGDEFGFFGGYERWDPAKEGIGDAWGTGAFANVVFDFWFVYDLGMR